MSLIAIVRQAVLDAYAERIARDAGVDVSDVYSPHNTHLIDEFIDEQPVSWVLQAISDYLEDFVA